MFALIICLILGVLCYLVAASKGYSAFLAALGGFLGGFPSGLVLLIVLILLPDRNVEHAELSTRLDDCRREIDALKQRIADLEAAQPHVESEENLHEEVASQDEAIVSDGAAQFPTRVKEDILCPRCKARQPGNRNLCYSCGLPFSYEDE